MKYKTITEVATLNCDQSNGFIVQLNYLWKIGKCFVHVHTVKYVIK